MNERPACRLTDAVHLSHFEDKTLKVLRSSTYSLLTSRTRRPPKKNAPCFPDLRAPDFLFKKERAFFLRCSALNDSGRWRGFNSDGSQAKNGWGLGGMTLFACSPTFCLYEKLMSGRGVEKNDRIT